MKPFAWRFSCPQSGTHETEAPGYPVQALHYFIFMKLRSLVFILCKHFTISFSWNSGPWFSSCASSSLFHFHESQSPGFILCKHFTISFSWNSGPWFHPVQALHYFIFMKLRPLVFILCKHFTISFSCNSGPWLSSCASTSLLHFHETQAPGLHPVQALHYFIFMKLRSLAFILCKHFTISFSCNSGPWFSSCASTSLFHCHETQGPGFHPVQALHYFIFMNLSPLVFILCKHFSISFSWNSGPWFSSCASTSLFHFHETQAPGFHPVQVLHYYIFMKLRPLVFILCKHFTISFSWNSGPWLSSCASTSLFHFHVTQAPGFHPVQALHYFIVMKLRALAFILCKHFTISFSWISVPWFSSVQALHYFIFMKLRPLVFILCKHFTISFSCNSGPWFSSCASTSLFHCHETHGPGFHPVQALHYFIFMNLSPLVFILCKHFTISFSWISVPWFSSCASTSLFRFHESQSHVFSLCMNVTI